MKNKWKRWAALFLSALLVLQFPVFAEETVEPDAAKELEVLLDGLSTHKKGDLSTSLDVGTLSKNISERGLSAFVLLHLDAESAGLLLDEGTLPQGGTLQASFAFDPVSRKWELSAKADEGEETYLSGTLYADDDQLALSLPQFYEGALGIRSGSLMEQYNDSLIRELMDEEPLTEDVILQFFPRQTTMDGSLANIKSRMEKKADLLFKDLKTRTPVQKEVSGSSNVYHVVISLSELTGIFETIAEEYYASLAEAMKALPGMTEATQEIDETIEEMRSSINESLEELKNTYADEIPLEFYAGNDGLKSVHVTLTVLETAYEEESGSDEYSAYEEESAYEEDFTYEGDLTYAEGSSYEEETGYGEDFSYQDYEPEGEQAEAGTMEFDLSFADPLDPWREFDFRMDAVNREETSKGVIMLTKETETTGTRSETTIALLVKEDDDVVYWDIPVTAVYDSESKNVTAQLNLNDGSETVKLSFDGTFESVVPGESFVLALNELGISDGYQKAAVTGQLKISGDPGEIETPKSQMILELNQADLLKLITEIGFNAQQWSSRNEKADEQEYQTEWETSKVETYYE